VAGKFSEEPIRHPRLPSVKSPSDRRVRRHYRRLLSVLESPARFVFHRPPSGEYHAGGCGWRIERCGLAKRMCLPSANLRYVRYVAASLPLKEQTVSGCAYDSSALTRRSKTSDQPP
jgi:hypothetical protein